MSADTQHKTRALWLVGALHAFTHIYHVALLPLYLLMQRDFGFTSVGQATALVTVMMIAYFLPSYFLGVLADRVRAVGRRAVEVPADSYLMLGDNRGNSSDSAAFCRSDAPTADCWRWATRTDIVGNAFVIFWPITRWSGL